VTKKLPIRWSVSRNLPDMAGESKAISTMKYNTSDVRLLLQGNCKPRQRASAEICNDLQCRLGYAMCPAGRRLLLQRICKALLLLQRVRKACSCSCNEFASRRLASAANLQGWSLALAANLQAGLLSATNLQARRHRSPHGAQRNAGRSPDCGAARLHPGYATRATGLPCFRPGASI